MRRFAHSRYVTILDQIVSSLSNFALVALVAGVATTAEFGRFSLGYVLLLFFLGFQRALVGEVLLVRFSNVGERPREVDGAAAGVSASVGVVSALALAVCGLLSGGDPLLWVVLAVAGPLVFVQDIVRYILIARARSGHALVSDAVWAIVALPAMVWLVAVSAPAWAVAAAWTGGGVIALVVAIAYARVTPRPVAGARWLVENRDIAVRFSGEYASLNLSNTVVWFGLAAPLGLAGVAALRGASLLFSPLNTAFNAVRIAVVPDLVRNRGTRRYRARLRETALILFGICAVWSAVVLLLPAEAGRLVLGETWDAAADLRWPYAVQGLAMVVYTALLAHFRAAARHTSSTAMRGVLAAATLVLPMALAVAAAASGAAWGFAAAVAVSVVVGLVWETRARRRDARRDGDSPHQPTETDDT
ncbi:MAG: hypothetical protein P0Y48_13050 [Candidatus Microbacterium phytovorans]|uniref:O-antigen/teichoic acid export membrane protein n=1 Tax=Candidatus Microbacterium phytovorans TaxID=3121374 RepID=A0AAJ6B521_9MICO|nr:hypothetical protein [Microbacterium sp.]WEK13371.1 MAG: hypothetical protein P0Y48_13050 [Microbacterium sp.]